MSGARAKRVDLDEGMATTICRTHITLDQCKQPEVLIFRYRAKSIKAGPHWADLSANRLLLTDLIKGTGGCLLRQQKWEAQVAQYLSERGVSVGRDMCSMIAYRPRIMLSHLLRARQQQSRIPKEWHRHVAGLVGMMNVAAAQEPEALAESHQDVDSNPLISESRKPYFCCLRSQHSFKLNVKPLGTDHALSM